MSTAGEQRSRTGAVGCSATPLPRWTWGCLLAFVAAIAATVVGAIMPPSTALSATTVVAYAANSVGMIALGLWVAFPERFRRNR